MKGSKAVGAIVWALSLGMAGVAEAQSGERVRVVPGEQYRAGDLQESLMGDRYRELWTTPIEVPLLDLETFAGGLTPVRRGGFRQTRSLRFRAADGREFNFRSVNKEVTTAMPDFLRETVADWALQDMTSAQLPASPVVAGGLLDAVGVLHPGPRLVVMPDDPRLGQFREEFAGMLGTIEVHPDEGEDNQALFANAERVAGTDRLFEHLAEDLDHRVDERAFLKARLMDVFLGDFDRHGGQWRWARYTREDGLRWWVPVPEDRDYAFVDYDGHFLAIARQTGFGRLVRLEPRYPDMAAMVDNSLDFTRRLVAGLDRTQWEAVVAEMMEDLSDEVIENAVRAMPEEHHAIIGDDLTRTLIGRRDRIPEMARELYRLLSTIVEVHGTESDDRLTVERLEGGAALVQLWAGDDEVARFRRVVEPQSTDEVRIYLGEGDDQALITGDHGGVMVRIVGGEGDDRLEDRSAGPTALYDAEGENQLIGGRRTEIDTRKWLSSDDREREPDDEEDEESALESREEEIQVDSRNLGQPDAPEWGESGSWFAPVIGWRSHAELIVGGGPTFTQYGFRHSPRRAHLYALGLYAPLHHRLGLEFGGELHRSNSSAFVSFTGLVSNLEASVFHGYGNLSADGESRSLRIWRRHARFDGVAHLRDTDDLEIAVGAVVERFDPEAGDGTNRAPATDLLAEVRAGATAVLEVDRRDDPLFPTSGVRLEVDAEAFPGESAVTESVVRLAGTASTYLPLRFAVLALRTGYQVVRGDFAYYDAVYLGGSDTLRGFHHERFAGDRAAFGGAELRAPLFQAKILVRGTVGVSAFADAGRVWFDGDSPGGWHTGVGGGLWFRLPVVIASAGYAQGEESRLYARLGLPF